MKRRAQSRQKITLQTGGGASTHAPPAAPSPSSVPDASFSVSNGSPRRLSTRGAELRSGLVNQSQKMKVAAMQMADMKVWAKRSYGVWARRQALILPNRTNGSQ